MLESMVYVNYSRRGGKKVLLVFLFSDLILTTNLLTGEYIRKSNLQLPYGKIRKWLWEIYLWIADCNISEAPIILWTGHDGKILSSKHLCKLNGEDIDI